MDKEALPLEKRVGRTSIKRPRGRIILPSDWIGNSVIVAPSEKYIMATKAEYSYLRRKNRNFSLIKTVFENILNSRSHGKKMFSVVTKTWNPVTGCLHHCEYCWARSLAETKLRNSHRYKEGFKPRLNEKEFRTKFKNGEFVFVSDMGDLFGDFVPDDWIFQVFDHTWRFPKTFFLFLTKNPRRYERFLESIPENVILGATIETNRDQIYLENIISRAALPSIRYAAMKELDWNKKFISVEPILDFDLEVFGKWLEDISPFMMYAGYDNYDHDLPEPPLDKTLRLIEEVSRMTLVVRKTIRPAWFESSR